MFSYMMLYFIICSCATYGILFDVKQCPGSCSVCYVMLCILYAVCSHIVCHVDVDVVLLALSM